MKFLLAAGARGSPSTPLLQDGACGIVMASDDRLDALIADALDASDCSAAEMAPCSVACDGSASCTGASDRQARERRAKGLPTCHEYRWHAM